MIRNKKIIVLITSLLLIGIIAFLLCLGNKKGKNLNNNILIDNNQINDNIQVEKVSTYNNPIVPEGFKKVETDFASWKLESGIPKGWNKGLVIEDDIGNQFVWVPVNLENVVYYPEVEKKFRYNAEDLDINNIEDKQILKYGGFYISRYEAGVAKTMQKRLKDISEKTNDIAGIPVSKKGIIPWNFISLKNSKINAESMYNNDEIKSGLPTLKQWEYMMVWLYSCKYDVYEDSSSFGNYSNVNFRFSGFYSEDYGESYRYAENKMKAGTNMILSTGATDRNMTNNIYDLAGNLWCYTNDYCPINENEILGYYCAGGHFDHKGDWFVAYNYNLKNTVPLEKVGFRMTLHMN